MTTAMKLTDTQRLILRRAVKTGDGKLDWFPDNVKGGARKKVTDSLFKRALITTDGRDWFVAAEGYDALGLPPKAPITVDAVEEAVQIAEASWQDQPAVQPPATEERPLRRTREGSKQAQVIAMLRRPEGATLAQICAATGWLKHTARGCMAGALKKKLGLDIAATKDQGAERVYRVIGR